MTIKKRFGAIMLASALSVSCLAGCGSGDTGSSPAGSGGDITGDITIGMTVNNASADSYQTAYYSAMDSYAQEQGVTLNLLDPVGDVTKQQNQVQDLISMKCDTIILWPVNSESGVSMVKSINSAGIPVMCSNTNVAESGEEYMECYVGPSNVIEGQSTAEQMIEDIGTDAKIVYIDGPAGYTSCEERYEGLELGIEGTNIEIVETQVGEANREKSQQVMENYLIKYPEGEIDAVFCFDDNCAIGAINAMEAAGRSDIKVYAAASGDYGTLTYVESGKLAATAMQSPITDAHTALDYAIRIANGEKIDEFFNYMDTPVVTPANIDSVEIEEW